MLGRGYSNSVSGATTLPTFTPLSHCLALPGPAGHLSLLADFEPMFSTPAASMAWCPNGSEGGPPQGHGWEGAQLA